MHGKVAVARKVDASIVVVRGTRVILSHDLAALYEVSTGALVQAVKRNRRRFPTDFMFQLSTGEWRALKSQIVISKRGGIRRARPYAFTEQGVAMLSSVLKSSRAVAVNVEIMRAFVRLRRAAGAIAELAQRFDELERKYDGQFTVVFDAIRELMAPPAPQRRRIGYRTESRVRPPLRA